MDDHSSFDDKERIRQALSIEMVLGSYLDLRRQGSAFVAVCPWHDDHRPSLQINPARQSWKCWVCDIGGDIFSFVMRRENVEFAQAMQILADMAGIQLTRRSFGSRSKFGDPNDKPTLYKAMEWVERQFHEYLKTSSNAQAAREYLAERGIQESAVDFFRIGYSPDQFDWLLHLAKATDFSQYVLQAIGVVKASEKSSGFYDRFRGRIIFPIRDVYNRPVAVGGRILPDIARQHEAKYGDPPAKYINSPETRLFSKSEQLYGLNSMREAIAKSRHLIAVEGYTDVIAAWQAGLDNVVAVLGTALGPRHLRLIRRFAEKVTLVLDGDDAGVRRSNEVLELFVTADVDLRILTLPEQLDPCDYLERFGAADFRQLVSRAADAIEHKINLETRGIDLLNDTHRAHQALERILGTIAASPRQMKSKSQTNLREQQLLSRLSRAFQVDVEQLRKRMSDKRSSSRIGNADRPDKARNKLALTGRDCELIQVILEDPENFPKVFENLTAAEIGDESARQLFEMMCQCHHAGILISFEHLMTVIEDPELKNILHDLDEASQAKAESTSLDVNERLDQLLAAFDRIRQQTEERQAISKLEAETDDAHQEEIMKSLLERTLQRQGYSEPTDG